jgi:hypothetical protein
VLAGALLRSGHVVGVNHTDFGALPARWVGAAIGRIGPIYKPRATLDSSMQARRDRSRSPRFVASARPHSQGPIEIVTRQRR